MVFAAEPTEQFASRRLPLQQDGPGAIVGGVQLLVYPLHHFVTGEQAERTPATGAEHSGDDFAQGLGVARFARVRQASLGR